MRERFSIRAISKGLIEEIHDDVEAARYWYRMCDKFLAMNDVVVFDFKVALDLAATCEHPEARCRASRKDKIRI